MLNRRRFLSISAAALGLPSVARAGRTPIHLWSGVALGAHATIRLAHPDAPGIAARAAAEIDRLEDVFSLYRSGSALMRLNATGRLDTPPPDLLECLTLAGAVYRVTGGLFDPTVQPLWAIWAERVATGMRPTAGELAAIRARGGWPDLHASASALSLARGSALTLNGIAQGYIADRIAALLASEGLTDILIDTGEHRALGGHPDGGAWPVRLAQGGEVGLRSRALATSAPLGTVFDAAGTLSHILHPVTGEPTATRWRAISISAPSAALADALSTAACLAGSRDGIDAFTNAFAGARCESAVLA
jgi:thiamine biosynthesis lipoprotein